MNLQNLITNGSLAAGTTGWTMNSAYTVSQGEDYTRIAVTSNGTSTGTLPCYQVFTDVEGSSADTRQVLYVRARVRGRSGNSSYPRVYVRYYANGGKDAEYFNLAAVDGAAEADLNDEQWHTMSLRLQTYDADTGDFRRYNRIAFGITVANTRNDQMDIGSVAVINLTEAFGAGAEPTKEWCDQFIVMDGDIVRVDLPDSLDIVVQEWETGWEAALSWAEVPPADEYQIYVNGELYTITRQTACYVPLVQAYAPRTYKVLAVEGDTIWMQQTVYGGAIRLDDAIEDLVTDRTREDVDRVRYLARKYPDWTEEEEAEWFKGVEKPWTDEGGEQYRDITGEPLFIRSGCLKGAYNARDLNRVEGAVRALTALLGEAPEELRDYASSIGVAWDSLFYLPYDPADYTPVVKTDWPREAIPTASEMARYLGNVKTIITAIEADYPELPESMDRLDYTGANAIEQSLSLLHNALLAEEARITKLLDDTAETFVYSGQPYSGMVWTQIGG